MKEIQDRIFLDYAAATPVDERVLAAMQSFWAKDFAHPWSVHAEGRKAHEAIERARESIARSIGARSSEVVFTGSGTESNALALRGVLERIEKEQGRLEGLHMILSSIEHPSVRDAQYFAEEKGMEVSLIAPNKDGIITTEAVSDALKPETVLVSVQYVNGEIGVINPISDIARTIKKSKDSNKDHYSLSTIHYPLFHSDATQALRTEDCNVEKLGVDLMTFDAHKIYGPKGVGALYVRKGTLLASLFFSAKKESIRGGTPPTPLIVGFQKAVEILRDEQEQDRMHCTKLKDYFTQELKKNIPNVHFNGAREHQVPQTISISFKDADHELLHTKLDLAGIACSTTSACLSLEKGLPSRVGRSSTEDWSSAEGSYVITSLPGRISDGALRFSFGRESKKTGIESIVQKLTDVLI